MLLLCRRRYDLVQKIETAIITYQQNNRHQWDSPSWSGKEVHRMNYRQNDACGSSSFDFAAQPHTVSVIPATIPITAGNLRPAFFSPNNQIPPANATKVLPRRRLDTIETNASGSRNASK